MYASKKRKAPDDRIHEQDAGSNPHSGRVVRSVPVRLPEKHAPGREGGTGYGHHLRRRSVEHCLSLTTIHPNLGGGEDGGMSSHGTKRRHSELELRQDGVYSQQSFFLSRKRQRLDPGLQVPAPQLYSAPNIPKSEDPGAEIIIRGLPEDVTESEVKESVAETFHREPYVEPGAPPFNFHITLRVCFPEIWEVPLYSLSVFLISAESRSTKGSLGYIPA